MGLVKHPIMYKAHTLNLQLHNLLTILNTHKTLIIFQILTKMMLHIVLTINLVSKAKLALKESIIKDHLAILEEIKHYTLMKRALIFLKAISMLLNNLHNNPIEVSNTVMLPMSIVLTM